MLDPLKRNPHSLTLHLAYNVDNSVVDAHGNAPSELLTELEAVESHGSRDMRKELVVQVKKELWELETKVIQAPGVGKEEKVEEKLGEAMDEKAGVEDLHMEARPSIAPAGGRRFRVGRMEVQDTTQPQAKSAFTQPANSNIRTLPSSKVLQKSATPT